MEENIAGGVASPAVWKSFAMNSKTTYVPGCLSETSKGFSPLERLNLSEHFLVKGASVEAGETKEQRENSERLS